jgi:hypothetical protein
MLYPMSHRSIATHILFAAIFSLPSLTGETPLVDQEGRFNDEPSMARASDGSLYVAWNGFRGGADALVVARYRFADGQFQKAASWQALGGAGTYILGPRVVAVAKGVVVLYAAEHGRQWDVFALPCDSRGPGRPVALVSDAAVDIKPNGVWRDGVLWVTWESNRDGARRILLSSLRNGKASRPEVASAGGKSNYAPSVAVESNGAVAVAWHSFREQNYDIFLRRRTGGGQWGSERRMTHAATIDRHPVLLAHKSGLWLLYENAQLKGYRTGNSFQRRIIVGRITPQGLEAPKNYRESSPLYAGSEAVSPVFDDTGRLWLAYLRPRLPRAGWEVWFTGYNGEQWEQPRSVSEWKGMDRQPALIVDHHDTTLLAYQVDDFPETWNRNPEATAKAKSQIMLASVDLRAARSAASALALEPLAEPGEPFEAGQLRVAYGEDAETPTIDYQGGKLKLLYGDLHTHSDISVCNRCGDQSVDENYQVRRDINRLDFACMTDHGYNIVPYLWNYTAKMARVNEDSGRLMTFLAQEWTSSFEKYDQKNPYGYYGHRNLILADPFFPKWWNANIGQTPSALWDELRKMGANFVNIPHQLADTGNVPTDWSYVNEQAQPVAEIFQNRGSYEYMGTPRQAIRSIPKPGWYIQDAWARGTVIGVIASPDHGGGRGKACVYALDLSRESILNAIRARHTFGTTAARIFLDVRVNGRLMGDKIAASDGKPVEVEIHVRCPGDIDRVEVCRNNQFIYVKRPEGKSADLTFEDTAPLEGYSYYYVRVMQKDNEIAWSSPVWFGAK